MSTAVGSTKPAPRSRRTTTASDKPTTTAKKPVSTKKATATTKKPTASKPAASGRPSWKDIIKECIVDHKDDARVGVSRTTIKKFAEERYGVEVTGTNLFQLNRAITSGAESGIFVLPKGPSGKVKLGSKSSRPSASKENSKPSSKTATIKKPLSTTTTKKVLANKKSAATATATAKKTSSGTKRDSAKKAVTGTSKAKAAAVKKSK